MHADLLRVVDAAYRFDRPDDEWLREVAEEARAALPGASGVVAWTFRASDPRTCEGRVAVGLEASQLEVLSTLISVHPQVADPALGALGLGVRPLATSSVAETLPAVWRALEALGVREVLFAAEAAADGVGFALLGCRSRRARTSQALSARWEAVLRQVVQARSLRDRLGVAFARAAKSPADPPGTSGDGEASRPDPPDASASATSTDPDGDGPTSDGATSDGPATDGPDGEESGRAALRREARLADRLAADAGCDPEAARQAWQEVLEGRWIVVDRHDAEGRCCLIARARSVGGERAARLGETDGALLAMRARGDSLKVIAGELGLSVSAVSRRLERAMATLGLRTPGELAELFAGDSPAGG